MKIRLKWPFDVATTLSIIAIVLSGVQFILTTPVLTEFYLAPELVVTGSGSSTDAKAMGGVFRLTNEGRAAANNVQLGLTLEEHQRISIMPNINAKIVPEEKSIFIKNVRIEIPKLTPKETVMIIVVSGHNGEQLRPDVAKFFVESGVREIPMVSFIKSDEGFGKNLTKSVDFELLKRTDITSHSSGPAEAGR